MIPIMIMHDRLDMSRLHDDCYVQCGVVRLGIRMLHIACSGDHYQKAQKTVHPTLLYDWKDGMSIPASRPKLVRFWESFMCEGMIHSSRCELT